MLFEEAIWVGEKLQEVCKSGDKVLNIGSSNLQLRKVIQPHIHKYVFEPLDESNISVIHCDIKKENGVDLVGDVTKEKFNSQLKELDVNCVLCSNFLEHILDRKIIVDSIDRIIPKGGYCLLTVPKNYPFHLDPIDTMYRPRPEELAELFPSYELVHSKCVSAHRIGKKGRERNYFQMLLGNPSLLFRMIVRSFFPFYKYQNWKITIGDIKNMFKDFQVSCVLLQKQ